jgi:orotidine-5'-phosphate decarboxylase
MAMAQQEPLIYCAIDTRDLRQACDLAAQIVPITGGIKLGLEFFNAFGPQGVEKVMRAAGTQASLFLDLKFHDIPNTVAGAVRSICENLAPDYLNVHAVGGLDMMRAAKEACSPETKLLAVTVLTSMSAQDLRQTGVAYDVETQVQGLTEIALQAKLDGIVCSAHEIEAMRDIFGSSLVLMVPGIRPDGSVQGDQKRVMTPRQAITAGATHLVIGRPITQAENPAMAARKILEDMSADGQD